MPELHLSMVPSPVGGHGVSRCGLALYAFRIPFPPAGLLGTAFLVYWARARAPCTCGGIPFFAVSRLPGAVLVLYAAPAAAGGRHCA